MERPPGEISLRGLRAFAAAAALLLPVRSAVSMVSADGSAQLELYCAAGGGQLSGGGYSVRGAAGQTILPDNPGATSGAGYSNRIGFYNPPRFSFQKGLSSFVESADRNFQLFIPAGAVEKEMFDITLNAAPQTDPLTAGAGAVDAANSKIVHNEGPWSQMAPGDISEAAIFDETGYQTGPLAQRGWMRLKCRDDDGDGILDGSDPPVRMDTLGAWVLDEPRRMWVKLGDGDTASVPGMVSIPFGMPGVYALIGAVDETVKDVYAFPVPFRPNGPRAGSGPGQTGTEADGITFANVPQRGDIEIYTLDGRLIRKLRIPDGLIIPSVKWDVRAASGDRAPSGTYIWRVVSGSNSKTGKLMVIW